MHHDRDNGNTMQQNAYHKLKAELQALDSQLIDIDGSQLKPSQCYHVDTNPPHVLFNTNCPESLKEKIQAILGKYLPADESGTPQ